MVKRDYSKGLIYKIVCNDTECKSIYIGSTISFKHRKSTHKECCNNENSKAYNFKVYESIRANGGWDNWKMVLVEYYPCETKLELEKREREIYDELKADLNVRKPIISKEEKLEYKREQNKKNKEYIKEYGKEYRENNKEKRKEYIENNKEQIKQKSKEYYEKNKEKILEQQYQKKLTCVCGSIVYFKNKLRHERTKKHIKYIEQQK